MIFSLGHGHSIVVARPDDMNESTMVGRGKMVSLEATGAARSSTKETGGGLPPGGVFRYYAPDAAEVEANSDTARHLDRLAEAMVDEAGDPPETDSDIPPVYTYFGQFIDHDITANTDRDHDNGVSVIDGDILPMPRDTVAASVVNLRAGNLGLDSLYGDGPDQSGFALKLARLMRDPQQSAKMFIGQTHASIDGRPLLPVDDATDLLRLKRLMDSNLPEHITKADLEALPEGLRKAFLDDEGEPRKSTAIIGDGRNDENLLVAQFHLAMLRFHNKSVDFCQENGFGGDAEALFLKARDLTRWHYQWLVVNDYLKQVCDPKIVEAVIEKGASYYTNFFKKSGGTTNSALMPMPLEFSVSAFRFGHTMVRGAYDHNQFFESADFDLLFGFTGGAKPPMKGVSDELPSNWIIEWERFVEQNSKVAGRAARRIDTFLSPPLENMIKEDAGIFKHLAKRNLRRGLRLNIPAAQDIIAALNESCSYDITPLSAAELTRGSTGEALQEGGFVEKTPLWFYILKEAEEQSGGAHLGQLGSVLVAETIVGLVANDQSSYWWQEGAQGRWKPSDGVTTGGANIETVSALFKVAGVL